MILYELHLNTGWMLGVCKIFKVFFIKSIHGQQYTWYTYENHIKKMWMLRHCYYKQYNYKTIS